MSSSKNKYILKPENFTEAIDQKKNFSIQFVIMNRDVEIQLTTILNRLLSSLDRLYLRDALMTILKELITNAVKANAKRLYFQTKNLDINDKEDYRKGMEDFKNECLFHDSPVFQQLLSSQMRVMVYVKMTAQFPEISIMNTSDIRPEELQKINARIKKAYKYLDITEAFGDVLDDSEGAGLGLIMALMVFKNSGFEKKDFTIASKDNKTVFTIKLSESAGQRKIKDKLSEQITKVLDYIPSFKENILRLVELCDLPESTIQEISSFIKTDPGLSSSILKMANSAGYLTSHRVSTIEEAVMKIGLKGIKTLALATGVDNIISEKFPNFKEQWEISHKKAFYSYKIAIQMKNSRVSDSAYLAGLISNIGIIALMSADIQTMDKIMKLSGLKNITHQDLIEEMTLGISHATLSAKITEKWNFDNDLTETIKYHTRPHLAPEHLHDIINTVYLAYVLIEYETKRIRYQSIDPDSLLFFDIKNEEELVKLQQILYKAYNHMDEK
jgi:HD-like signal output (HDOD) protein